MLPHLSFRHPGVVLGILLPTLLPSVRAQSTIFNDTFSDGERVMQSLPNSVAWYHSTTIPANLSVRNSALVLAIPLLGRGMWAYFPVVSLKVGEAITFTYDFSFTGSWTFAESSLRAALAYTNGVPPRLADASAAPTGAYQGYGSISFSTNSTAILKRDGPGALVANASILATIGEAPAEIWRNFGLAGRSSPKASGINTPYTGILKVLRTGADTAIVTSSFTGGGLNSSSTVAVQDPGSIFANFDTVVFSFNAESLNGEFLITRANVSVSSVASITAQPTRQSVALGSTATFTTAATGNPAASMQWQRRAAGSTVWANLLQGGSYSGVTTTTLTVSNVTGAMHGDQFRVIHTNSAGDAISDAANLTVSASRLINLSVLTSVATGDAFTMGYVVGGPGTSGTKSILIRAAGPSLVPLGVAGVLDDPRLELFTGASKTGENDNWGGTAALMNAFTTVGAFAFANGQSRDAAALATILAGDNSVRVSAAGAGSGAVIAELYDSTPATSVTASTPRLVNVSVLKHLGSGLTAGFSIGGNIPKTILVRAIGPTLGAPPFNVPDVVADPQLALFSGSDRVSGNDNWSGSKALVEAFSQVGAFLLPATSGDAAIVTTLSPGNYTVQVSGIGGTTGVALVEIYDIDE
jgi:hypothetical protein